MRVFLVAVLLGIGAVSQAATLRVPDDTSTLTVACRQAADGDIIEIASGVWSPSLSGESFPIRLDRAVTLRGVGGSTILDAEFSGPHFEITGRVVLQDLVLKRGWSSEIGGSVRVVGGHAELTRIRFEENSSDADGNVLAVTGGEVTLRNCLLTANGMEGPTICVEAGTARIEYCTLVANAGSSVDVRGEAHVILEHSLIVEPGLPTGRAAGILVRDRATFELADNRFDGCFEGALTAVGDATLGQRRVAEARRADGLRTASIRFVDALHGDFRIRDDAAARFLGAYGGEAPMVADIVAPEGGEPERSEEPGLLGPSRPNPGSAPTIHFSVPRSTVVDLGIYNVLGQRVRSLISAHVESGEHTRNWNGRDDLGEELPPGIYFVRVTQGDITESRRIVLVR